jgi:hypothetical protein
MAGYSKRSLPEKLGIKSGSRIAILHPPANYSKSLGKLPENVEIKNQLNGSFQLIHFFSKKVKDLENRFAALKKSLDPNGALWVSWPKGASKLETDLNENIVRDIALRNGLVDVKVCAVDEDWSGLKLVYRLKDRK